jgi:Predicted membrane protein (DUF2142)
MRGVKIALGAGLALLVLAIVLTLSQSPLSVIAGNKLPGRPAVPIANTDRGASYCQSQEALPRATSAIRIWLYAAIGPRVNVEVSSEGRTITSGSRGSAWTGGSVTVPVKPLSRTVSGVTVCVSFRLHGESIYVGGNATPAAHGAREGQYALKGRVWIEYLRPGTRSWASMIPEVARHMGLGRAGTGTWIVFVALALLAAAGVLASRLLLGEMPDEGPARPEPAKAMRFPRAAVLGRVPRAAWICALVACLNAVCWSILMPAFEAPDEPAHFAYVKQLGETGSLPSSSSVLSSPEEIDALEELHFFTIRQVPQDHTIASRSEQRALDKKLASTPHDVGSSGAGTATSEPPLYYAIEALPYNLARSGTVLDRLALMRLLSALFAGFTALFVFLFVREALPGESWAWTVGGLSVALAPLLGFTSGVVNPDSMLFAVSAAIFYLLARAFRRGLGVRTAAAIGALTAAGLLTKINFVGLVPGVFCGVIVLSVREARASGRPAYDRLALALGIPLSPVLLYVAINVVSNHSPLGIVSGAIGTMHGSLLSQANYIWQMYLPRIPGTVNDFPGLFPTRQLWFNDYVGLYGWLDTPFPGWVDTLALIPASAIALLCGRSLFHNRATLRSRATELAVYAIVAVGLLLLIGAASYRVAPEIVSEYAQIRYLVPLLALFGAALALAARGAGRWGPAVGVLIVVLFLAHDIFSQLQVVARYYG